MTLNIQLPGAEGARCQNCGGDEATSHRATFCRVSGMCNEREHWCCPQACELDAQHLRQMRRENAHAHLSDVLTAAEKEGSHRGRTLEHGAMRLWSYDGVVLPAGNDGTVAVGDLAALVRYLETHDPDGRVLLHAYGLRWGRSLGTDHGPNLDWRDWDLMPPRRSICGRCGAPAPITHQSTFCKVTGEVDVVLHWCCPPDGCQLDNPEFRAEVEARRARETTLDPDMEVPF